MRRFDQDPGAAVQALEDLRASFAPHPHVLQALLNLAEQMEHNEQPIPIDLRTLAEVSRSSQAFAKALHYWELQFDINPESAVEPLR